MHERDSRSPGTRLTRRTVLTVLGTGGTLGLSGCLGDTDGDGEDDDADDGALDEDDAVRVGVSLPESGGRTIEGARLRDGYELAVTHLNDGTGPITDSPWDDVSADGGLLGRQVELVFTDNNGTENGARTAAETLIESENVDMFTGGASAAAGIAHQEVADENGVLYMGGFTPTDEVGGRACTPYAFNEMYNQTIAAESLGAVLGTELGVDSAIDFAQLTLDDDFGQRFERAMSSKLETVGSEWFELTTTSASSGVSYESDLQELLDRRPDLLVLNVYGRDGERALRNLESVIEADEDVSRTELTVVVPLLGPEMTENAGSALEDVYGTVHWLPGLGDHVSAGLEDAWDGDRETDVPSQFAHLAYVQVAQYAAAVERAGTLDAADVAAELSEYTYDLGMGEQQLRECDGQAMRYAPVVQGRPHADQQPGRYYELVSSVPDATANPPYSCDDNPAVLCER